MKLPDVLRVAGDHARDGDAALVMMRVAHMLEDDVSTKQFASEAEAALRQASSLLDRYLTFGEDADAEEGVVGF